MPVLWLLFAVLLSAAVFFDSEQTTLTRNLAVTEISAVSSSMLVYRNIVANYAYANPAMTGSAPDVLLTLPNWYVRPPSLSNYISAGKSYVFFSEPLPGLAGELARRTESTNVGLNQNGVLWVPNKANSGIVLPAQIPNGSVVIIQ